jgi:hypothetical protein
MALLINLDQFEPKIENINKIVDLFNKNKEFILN